MNRSISVWACLAALMVLLSCSRVFADDDDAAKPAAAKAPAEKQPAPSTKTPFRQLAPGVMISVDPLRKLEELVSRHNVVELLAVDPKFDWAKDVPFRRDIWALDFKFKPVRMISVDIPQPSGYMQRKLIWYMVYSVTNTGQVMHPVETEDLPYEVYDKRQLATVEMVDRPVRFTPEFLLEAQVRRPDKSILKKVYPDRVIPVAMGPIRLREDPFFDVGRDVPRAQGGRDAVGHRHLGRHRPENFRVFRVRRRPDELVSLDRPGGRVQERRSDRQGT